MLKQYYLIETSDDQFVTTETPEEVSDLVAYQPLGLCESRQEAYEIMIEHFNSEMRLV